MDALAAELERKRKLLDPTGTGQPKKYFRKADLDQRKLELARAASAIVNGGSATTAAGAAPAADAGTPVLDAAARQLAAANAAANASSASPMNTSSAPASASSSSITASSSSSSSSSAGAAAADAKPDASGALVPNTHRRDTFWLPQPEVIRRLRERDHPIRLFGETNEDVLERLRQLEIVEPDTNKGFRNDFMDAIGVVDQEMLDELMQQEASSRSAKVRKADTIESEKTSFQELQKQARGLDENDIPGNLVLVLKLLKYLLKLWETELDERSEEEKRAMAGKLLSATVIQTLSYLKPLFRLIKQKAVPDDIAPFLIRIVRFMLEREYSQAGDSYMKMAIGNAPWPMGVTMVGIHARGGREKISAGNIAHVLNDETARKYIQALKRLMTVCQRRFPAAPSKSLEFVRQ
ncbi:hypothetical protein CAOG_00799 [Capsaspora owczarzaki ATCC 30864]|uniref:Pre-mRNA-splicing factor 18 n=1 Tax=Capsaspora owczarzaki (strain ATCC 30864) TaxID=595528 RepID=A0A0D2X0M1_CAPO3|nr:hypothetical protein CAOG_00799 [Capsaspora owczarzaki ATCC 30864]KJE89299.1 hypothetical protein CAOG_000799 [Capsaspora owczarzaki ATCC 30864]|eukprot:XP_004365670.2 hypothetical protein CAOG_00799 [Capsaspora owczarzaki ATCC 30864]